MPTKTRKKPETGASVVQVSGADFDRALTQARRFLPSRPNLPIIAYMLAEIGDGRMTLAATDLKTTVKLNVPAGLDAFQEGTRALLPSQVYDVVHSLRGDALTLTFGDVVTVRGGGGKKADFATSPAADYPPMPTVEGAAVDFEASDFASAVDSVAYAAASEKETSRPYLQGVLIQSDVVSSMAAFATADGQRVAERMIPYDGEPFKVVVMARDLIRLATMLPDEGNVRMTADEKRTMFAWDGGEVICNTPYGDFVDYQKVLTEPDDWQASVKVNRLAFLREVEVAAVFADLIRLHVDTQGIAISVNSASVGQYDSVIEGDDGRGDVSFALAAVYMREALRSMDTDMVTIGVTAPNSPVMFQADNVRAVIATMFAPPRVVSADPPDAGLDPDDQQFE